MPRATGAHLPGIGVRGRAASARSPRLATWALTAATGGFIFGYQVAVISGALLFIRRDLGLTDAEQGVLVAVMPLGAMAGGLLAGRLASSLGRRGALLVGSVVVAAGTVLTIVAPALGLLLAGRAIIGLAVGVFSSTVPLYLAEIAPVAVRGRLVTVNQLMVTLGILVAYLVDLAFSGSGSWRAMFAVGLLPAAALLAGMVRAPETPAWLDSHGRPEEARRVAIEVAGRAEADRMLEDDRRSRAEEGGRVSARELVRSSARPMLIIAVALATMQQWVGINAIVSYAPRIMERTGLSASNSILASVTLGVVNVVATVVAVRLVDQRGRRPLLFVSLAGMLAALAVLALSFAVSLGSADSWVALVALLTYMAAFAIGMGPIFWLLVAEIFPPEARAVGAGIATATVWFWNVVVNLVFLPIAAAIGPGATFWIFAAVCAVALAFVRRYVPETKGRSFADIAAEVRSRWRGARAADG